MIRLRRDDFEDEHELARFAATAHMSLQEFRDQFEYLIRDELPAIHLFDQNLAKAMRESSAARAAAVKPLEAASAAKGGTEQTGVPVRQAPRHAPRGLRVRAKRGPAQAPLPPPAPGRPVAYQSMRRVTDMTAASAPKNSSEPSSSA